MTPASVVARSRDALHRVLDGEAVIVDLSSGTYFGLNEVGTRIWERIDGRRTAEAIAAGIVEEFDVDSDRAVADVVELLARLAARNLVVPGTAAP